jgi:hypothetical protein
MSTSTVEKQSKTASKNRRTKNRNNSILTSNKKENLREPEHDTNIRRSHSSLANVEVETSLLEQYKAQVKELSEEKEMLLGMVKSNEKEMDFLNQVIIQVVDMNEILRIRQNSKFDEGLGAWVVPPFMVQQRKTVFPKLQRTQATEVVQNEMKHRKVVFKSNGVGNEAVTEKEDETGEKECAGIRVSEMDGRPVTSIAKYRQRSMCTQAGEGNEESRKSPLLQRRRKRG